MVTDGKTMGTGALVSRSLVLTASHVVTGDDGKLLPVRFYANTVEGTPLASARAVHVWRGTNQPQKYVEYDWAIMQLDTSLGQDLGWFGVADTSKFTNADDYPDPLWVAGYSSDYRGGFTATVDETVRVRRILYGFLLHDASETHGSSGCPMFRMETGSDGKWEGDIYGLNVGEIRKASNQSQSLPDYDPSQPNISLPSSVFFDTLTALRRAD